MEEEGEQVHDISDAARKQRGLARRAAVVALFEEARH